MVSVEPFSGEAKGPFPRLGAQGGQACRSLTDAASFPSTCLPRPLTSLAGLREGGPVPPWNPGIPPSMRMGDFPPCPAQCLQSSEVCIGVGCPELSCVAMGTEKTPLFQGSECVSESGRGGGTEQGAGSNVGILAVGSGSVEGGGGGPRPCLGQWRVPSGGSRGLC